MCVHCRRALEVLMRKVLMLPGRPALVYLHWWSPTTNQGSRSFWNHTVQPESGLLAEYYGLPALSMRNVWYHKWAANEPGFLSRDVMCGINHPNYLGHQCAPPSDPCRDHFLYTCCTCGESYLHASTMSSSEVCA